MDLCDLLDRGYFPKELPPPFITNSFARAVTASGATLPTDFTKRIKKNTKLPCAKHTKYSHARGGFLRRHLSLPNPVLYFRLCSEIFNHWTNLQPHIGGTELSATAPVFASSGRAIKGRDNREDRRELAITTRLNNKYILRTDISRFYHSVYTHSIPWGLHGKANSKAHRYEMGLLGNKLDLILRRSQGDQTVGIPIGPDTSLVLAEILMQKCDRKIIDMFPGIQGHRYIDDYELGFRDISAAEAAYHQIDKILAEYELALNPKKTEIIKLPYNIEAAWAGPIRSFTFRSSKSGQRNDLLRYFDFIFELHNQYPDDPLLNFAIGRLRHLTIDPSNWLLFQHLLLDCVTPEPATLQFVLELIIERVNAGSSVDLDKIGPILNNLIIDHSELGHSSELAWALWACLALDITVCNDATAAVSKCDDSVVALLALHCDAERLVESPIDKTMWLQYMTEENLYDEHWLLCYEANVKNWLPSHGGSDHVSDNDNFSFLKSQGVSFYDETQAIRPMPGAPIPVPTPHIPPTTMGS